MKIYIFILLLLSFTAVFSRDACSIQHPLTIKAPTNQELQQQIEALSHELECIKSDSKDNTEYYLSHISDTLMLVGLLITILVAIVGIVIPLGIQRRKEKQVEDSLTQIINDIKKLQNLNKSFKIMNTDIIKLKNDALTFAKEAATSATQAEISKLQSNLSIEQDFEKLLEIHTKIVELDPQDNWAYISRGDLYNTNGVYDKAIADYDIAIDLDPTLPVPYFHKSTAYRGLLNSASNSEDKVKHFELSKKAMAKYHELLDATRK